jgi:hypothetical protein
MTPTTRTPLFVAALTVLTVGLLAGCAPAAGTGIPAGTAAAGSSGSVSAGSAPGGSTKASCAEFTSAAFSALVTVPIGKPYVAGSDSGGGVVCWYGIGKNADVTGSKVETLADDNILITTIGFGGAGQYAHFTGSDVNIGAVTPIDGIGTKASYNVSVLSGNVPQLYSYKGDRYCGIQLNADSAELVDPAPAATAKNEGALCDDAFASE